MSARAFFGKRCCHWNPGTVNFASLGPLKYLSRSRNWQLGISCCILPNVARSQSNNILPTATCRFPTWQPAEITQPLLLPSTVTLLPLPALQTDGDADDGDHFKRRDAEDDVCVYNRKHEAKNSSGKKKQYLSRAPVISSALPAGSCLHLWRRKNSYYYEPN